MQQKYEFNSRVDYYVIRGRKRLQRVGFVKAYRRTLFGMRYFVCIADHSREVDIIRPSQIFGYAPKKEDQSNK